MKRLDKQSSSSILKVRVRGLDNQAQSLPDPNSYGILFSDNHVGGVPSTRIITPRAYMPRYLGGYYG